MQGSAIYGKPVVESVTLTMTADQAKLLHKFVAGTTSNSVVEATGLKYDKDDDEIYSINTVLSDLYDALASVKDLGVPDFYVR